MATTRTTPLSTYTLYTVDDVPFGTQFDSPRRVGRVTTGWNVSTTSLCKFFSSPSVVAADDGMITLNVFRYASATSRECERHPLDGTRYPSKEDADRAAYDAGLLAYMVYSA